VLLFIDRGSPASHINAQDDVHCAFLTSVEKPFSLIIFPISRAGLSRPPGLSKTTTAFLVEIAIDLNVFSSPLKISPLILITSSSLTDPRVFVMLAALTDIDISNAKMHINFIITGFYYY
jgi:hypothetical protein